MRLFQWKAERTGKEVVFLAGAGLAEGCTAAETRLEYKILPTQLQSAGPEEEDGKQKEQGQGKGRGRDEGEEKDAGEERKPKKAKRRLIGIQQVCCVQWVKGGVGRGGGVAMNEMFQTILRRHVMSSFA